MYYISRHSLKLLNDIIPIQHKGFLIVQNHLEDNKLIGDFQHGFRQLRSCLSQLLNMNEYMIKYLEDGSNYDFSKAFDKVDYSILARKLVKKKKYLAM